MKLLKIILIASTFFIMVAVIFNLLNILETDSTRAGVYLELLVMFLLMIAIVLVNNYEKKIKSRK